MKSIFASKTFRASAVTFVLGALMLHSNPTVVTIATILSDPSIQAELGLMASGIVHTVLRVVTDKPVKLI